MIQKDQKQLHHYILQTHLIERYVIQSGQPIHHLIKGLNVYDQCSEPNF